MYGSSQLWREVDEYFVSTLVEEDDALVQARVGSRDAGLPTHEVAPNQGALLALLTRVAGARRVLELGTLAGYSTIWLARAVGSEGCVTTLEVDPQYAALARGNLERAGVADRVDVVEGLAVDSLTASIDADVEPFDLVFLDADKPNNPRYLDAALQLTRPGSLIVADNVVRDGAVIDAHSADVRVQGIRRFLRMLAEHPRLEATALQTVGAKGWDGLALALVH